MDTNDAMAVWDQSKEQPIFSELPLQNVCERLACALPYPTVVISSNGTVVYKNEIMETTDYRWRIGASLKRYIGAVNFLEVMETKRGDYKALSIDGTGAVSLRFEEFFFVVFLPYFHMSEEHINVLYEYMVNIPEKGFFEDNRISAPESLSPEKRNSWSSFKGKFREFYEKRYSFLEEAHKTYFKGNTEYRHELYDILKVLTTVVNNRKHIIECEMIFKQENVWDDFWVRCNSEDLGVLMSMFLYLCLLFSSVQKPKIELNIERYSFEDISRVSFSVKSEMSEKEVEDFFSGDKFTDERYLYFRTVKSLASKYFWGADVKKNDDKLEFSLILHDEQLGDDWFCDSEPVTTSFVSRSFMEFASMLIGKQLMIPAECLDSENK